ncbi:protein of unknown function [Tenacibaculum aestuariivivum]
MLINLYIKRNIKKGIIIIFDKNDINIFSFKLFLNEEIKMCLINHARVVNFLSTLKKTSESDMSILILRKEKNIVSYKSSSTFFINNNKYWGNYMCKTK